MKNSTPDIGNKSRRNRIFKAFFFFLEIGIIIYLLTWWLSSDSIRNSQNLWVLFLYSFPSEFLVAIVPHEPALLYFGKFFPPLTVALVAVAGTVLTEILNYSVFKYIVDLKIFRKVRQTKFVEKTVKLFEKAPFLALLVAGLTPIPFYPFRFLVVLARYPLFKYAMAVFLSRMPRFYLIALLGHIIKFSDYLLLLFFILLLFLANIPIFRKLITKTKKQIVPPQKINEEGDLPLLTEKE